MTCRFPSGSLRWLACGCRLWCRLGTRLHCCAAAKALGTILGADVVAVVIAPGVRGPLVDGHACVLLGGPWFETCWLATRTLHFPRCTATETLGTVFGANVVAVAVAPRGGGTSIYCFACQFLADFGVDIFLSCHRYPWPQGRACLCMHARYPPSSNGTCPQGRACLCMRQQAPCLWVSHSSILLEQFFMIVLSKPFLFLPQVQQLLVGLPVP